MICDTATKGNVISTAWLPPSLSALPFFPHLSFFLLQLNSNWIRKKWKFDYNSAKSTFCKVERENNAIFFYRITSIVQVFAIYFISGCANACSTARLSSVQINQNGFSQHLKYNNKNKLNIVVFYSLLLAYLLSHFKGETFTSKSAFSLSYFFYFLHFFFMFWFALHLFLCVCLAFGKISFGFIFIGVCIRDSFLFRLSFAFFSC